MRQKIDALIQQMEQDIIDDTCALIEIESLSGDAEGNERALDFVLQRGRAFGMRTYKGRHRDVGIVEIGEGDEIVGLLAHVDVVAVGDLAKWTDPPFKGMVRDGKIWGRGSEDDKGPVIVSLYAMRAVQLLGIPLKKRIQLIVGTCEETVWTDIAHFKEEFALPRYGFSPDAAYPIFNVENGYCDVKLRFEDAKTGLLKLLDAGESPNTIPSLAQVRFKSKETVGSYHGTAAHSSTPQHGDNAITKMCKNDPDLADFGFARFVARFFGTTDNPVTLLGIDDGTDTFEGEPAGKTTAAPTVLKLQDGGICLNVNIRQKYGTTRADIEQAFGRFAAEYGYAVSIPDILEPMRTSEHLPPFQLMDAVQKEYGLPGGFKTAGGTTYAKSMPNFVSWGPILVEEGGTAHQEDENYSISTMMLSAKMYATWLARTAGDA